MWDNRPVIKITFMISNDFLIDVNLSINRYGAFLFETPPTDPAPINLLILDGFWCSGTVKILPLWRQIYYRFHEFICA